MPIYHDKLKDLKKNLDDEHRILINTRVVTQIMNEKGITKESIAWISNDSNITLIPILHNKDQVILQFYGWSINLYEDGTWIWTATDGG